MDTFTETIMGKIHFDPDDLTNKHKEQSLWKKHVIALIDEPELCEYRKWFIEKRFNLKLATPIRGPHFTIINDRLADFDGATEELYQQLQEEWNEREILIRYEYAPYTDGTHWWLRARSEQATELRTQMNLSPKPYWGFHITIGRVSGKEYEMEHGKYIHRLIQKGLV